ncbi:hypothetical protein CYLTODRAFT_459698 [Cylindrobasidium torrendii FP15055 ss-10]|uniref:Uncharacterized protein n=1 Tax=Cylindrobasidium torrendii FP15055 ss-10 TaxID=1314674 RepID=A0A0D7AUW4_9AGAR|nr:hypothetical protein CYLTODRAFT_459698 [Cylindrobasidium torrendii FP15055 ss-10]
MDALLNSTHLFVSSVLDPGDIATRTLIRSGSTPFQLYDLERSGEPVCVDVLRATTAALLHKSITSPCHLFFHHSDKFFIKKVAKPVLEGKCANIHDIARLFPSASLREVSWLVAALVKAESYHLSISFEKIPAEAATVLHNKGNVNYGPTPSFAAVGDDPLHTFVKDILRSMARELLPSNVKLLSGICAATGDALPPAKMVIMNMRMSRAPPGQLCLTDDQVCYLLKQCRPQQDHATEPAAFTKLPLANFNLTAGMANSPDTSPPVLGNTDVRAPFLRRKRAADYIDLESQSKKRCIDTKRIEKPERVCWSLESGIYCQWLGDAMNTADVTDEAKDPEVDNDDFDYYINDDADFDNIGTAECAYALVLHEALAQFHSRQGNGN